MLINFEEFGGVFLGGCENLVILKNCISSQSVELFQTLLCNIYKTINAVK
jgi:hypothetical protein